VVEQGGHFRDLQAGDVLHIAANLREADRRELAATRGVGVNFADAIGRAVLLSSHVWVGVAPDGEPISVFGVAPVSMLNGIGSPWFLSTDRAYQYPRTLVVEGRRYLSQMRKTYATLTNYVDVRNDKSIRWLKRMGFKIHPPTPYGVEGEPFHRFTMGAE
jgi:hypothetical protein